MTRPKLDKDPKLKRSERLTAFIDEESMKRIQWAAFVTKKSIGVVLGDLIMKNIKEPPKEIDEDPFLHEE